MLEISIKVSPGAKTCLDCVHINEPCHIKTLLSHIGFFDDHNVCKFFEESIDSDTKRMEVNP